MSRHDQGGSPLGSLFRSPLSRKLSACRVETHLNDCLQMIAKPQEFENHRPTRQAK